MEKISISKRLFTLFLAFVMLASFITFTPTTAYASTHGGTISIDGYDFYILWNNSEGVGIRHNDGTSQFVFELNLESADISVTAAHVNPLTRSSTTETFQINLNPNFSYISGHDIRGVELVNSATNETFNLDSIQRSRFVFAIPIGIPLTHAAVSALLAIAMAMVIGGVAYISASQVQHSIRNHHTHQYFSAILQGGDVWIGNALSFNDARVVVGRNHTARGVWATNFGNASALLGGNHTTPELHFGNGMFYTHIHPFMAFNMRGHVHVWFS